ncbi:jg3974 [Pararge aegeria aegeria]|uniref:Jg3974 protein n=1 Tax=Pararge aegeria aegeria TaxID=348720 RepID=A0A8S4S0P3_9NEOP|nr:jg3974 [Pararge aegeria aegeria]
MGGAHSSENGCTYVGVPSCWNGGTALESAALIDAQRGEQRSRESLTRAALDRGIWNFLQKTYVQQWTSIG